MNRQVQKLSKTALQCAETGAIYGNCVNKVFSDVQHKSCDKEFRAFKDCFMRNVGVAWIGLEKDGLNLEIQCLSFTHSLLLNLMKSLTFL